MWRRIRQAGYQAGYIVYKAGDNLIDNDGIEFAGYLTFLSLLALFPFLVLIVAAAGFIGQGELGARFAGLMVEYLPQQAIEAIEPRIREITSGPPQGLLTISILGAVWTSSSAVEGMRTVLNRAYQVSNPPTYVFRRLMSMVQVVAFTLVIIVVMSVLVFAPLVIGYLEGLLNTPISPEIERIWNRYFVYFGAFLLFVMVASLYFFLPNIKQNLLAVVPGAALVVALWVAGASGFTLYISNVDQVSIIYGSLGGFIATMLFFFIMNLIFIYGAEFNYLVAETLGAKVEEKEHSDEGEDIDFGHARHAARKQKPEE